MACAGNQLPDPVEGTHTDAELAGLAGYIWRRRAPSNSSIYSDLPEVEYMSIAGVPAPPSHSRVGSLRQRNWGSCCQVYGFGWPKEAAKAVQNNVFISKVKYVNWNDAPGIDNVLIACSRKDVCYQHETEVRVTVLGEFGNPLVKQRLCWHPLVC